MLSSWSLVETLKTPVRKLCSCTSPAHGNLLAITEQPVAGIGFGVRKIEIEQDLRVRFPGRGPEFDDGVEVGIIAAHLGLGVRSVERLVNASVLAQLESLARAMSYRVVVNGPVGDSLAVTVERVDARPSLRVVR